MVSFENLSVKVSAQTRDFQRGIENAADKLRGLSADALKTSAAMQVLGGRADHAGDELSETGREATGASAGIGLLGTSSAGASVSVRGLTTALTVGLLPALAVVSTALLPVVSALGGLVAIGASIAGVGLLGTVGALATNTEELKESVQPLIDTIQNEFGTAIQYATRVIQILIGDLTETISELVPTDEQIRRLAKGFLDLGRAVIDALPGLVDLATTLAVEFLPAAAELVDGALSNLPGLIRGMVAEFQRLAPMFMRFGRTLARLLPDLMEFGRTALSVVAPALGRLAGLVESGVEEFNRLDTSFQKTAVKASLLVGPLTGLVSLLGGPAGVGVLGAVIALKKAWTSNFADIRTTLQNAFGAIKRVLGDRLPTLISELKQLWRTLRPVVEPVVDFLVQALSGIVVNALDGVLSGLTAIVQLLNGDFSGAWQTVLGFLDRAITRTAEFWNKLSGGLLQEAVNAVISGLNKMGEGVENLLSSVGLGGQFDFETIEQVNIGRTPFQKGRGRASQPPAGPQEIRVKGELREKDGEITAKIDERVQVNSRRQRREYQNDRGGPTPR